MGKRFTGIAIIIIALGAFFFMLRPADESGSRGDGMEATRTLTIASRLWSEPHERQYVLDHIIAPFEEEHNCDVVLQVLDDTKLLQRVDVQQQTGDVHTDIVIAYVARMADWVDRGYVQSLDPYADAWSDRTFTKAFDQMTYFHDTRYFLPIGADDYLLCVHKDALAYKSERVDVQAITWQQLVHWAQAIAKGEGEGKFAVTGVAQKMLIYQVAAPILAYGGGFPDVSSESAIAAWHVLVGLHGALTPTISTYDTVVPPMKRGEAWLTVTHNARVGEIYASNPTQYIIAPAPLGPEGRGSVAGVSGLGIVTNAPNPELAAAFLAYLTRADTQVSLATGTGGFIPTVDEAITQLGDSLQDEVIRKSMTVLQEGELAYIPPIQNWSSVKMVYDQTFRKLVMEDGEVDIEYLQTAQETIDTFR